MEFDEIIVKESPGLCRCCLSEGCYKDLGTEYTWMNDTEVYADMLLECFDIGISQHNEGPNGPNRLICEVCITRLRDACNFKKQVLESEKRFVDMVGRGDFAPKVVVYPAMKPEVVSEEVLAEDAEVEYLEEDLMDYDDKLPIPESPTPETSDDMSLATLKVKNKRGRPRKTATVEKPEKKTKIAKTEDKPRTSKDEVASSSDNITNISLEQRTVLAAILQNSTAMPFRWSSNRYLCFYCDSEFTESSKLKQHTYIEHKDAKLKNLLYFSRINRVKLDVSNITCKRCPESIYDLKEFINHASIAHDIEICARSSTYLLSFKLSDDVMSCVDCGQKFDFFSTLLRHAHKYHITVSPYICEICGQGFVARGNIINHIRHVHSSKSCTCKRCGEIFPTANALKVHSEKSHAQLKCPLCPVVLKSRYLKKSHLAKVHDLKTVQFKCDQCQKIFTSRHVLMKHQSKIHLKQKMATCEICGYKAFGSYDLKMHKVCHSDERPFECEYCRKTFRRKATLQVHVRIHIDDKRYACKLCGKAFVQTASLKWHTKTHHT